MTEQEYRGRRDELMARARELKDVAVMLNERASSYVSLAESLSDKYWREGESEVSTNDPIKCSCGHMGEAVDEWGHKPLLPGEVGFCAKCGARL